MRFAYGRPVTVRRWTQWQAGVPVGDPDEFTLRGVALAPADEAADPATRRGHLIPRFTLYGAIGIDLVPHDLIDAPEATYAVSSSVRHWTHPMTGWQAGATCEVTQLVVHGPETVVVYPSVEVTEGRYGDTVRRPADEGVTVTGVAVEPLPATEDEQGQDTSTLWRLVGAGLEQLDEFSTVEWPAGSGRMFDVVGVPQRWPWPPEHPYTVVTIRERR